MGGDGEGRREGGREGGRGGRGEAGREGQTGECAVKERPVVRKERGHPEQMDSNNRPSARPPLPRRSEMANSLSTLAPTASHLTCTFRATSFSRSSSFPRRATSQAVHQQSSTCQIPSSSTIRRRSAVLSTRRPACHLDMPRRFSRWFVSFAPPE